MSEVRAIKMGSLGITLGRRENSAALLHAQAALKPYPKTILAKAILNCLARWASSQPDTVFIARRNSQ